MVLTGNGELGFDSGEEPEKRLPHPRKAAGAQITQSWLREVVTINNNVGPYGSHNWNEYNLKPLTSTNWRASLVPAAAVIPAPIAYIKVVAVKKLVVGFWDCNDGSGKSAYLSFNPLVWESRASTSLWCVGRSSTFTLNKFTCSKQAFALKVLAWNNL